jgi:tetratricopeptide (TPR) repeat protein
VIPSTRRATRRYDATLIPGNQPLYSIVPEQGRVGDESVRPHLAALAAIGELGTLVGAMQERGSFTPEELRALVVEVSGFREAGRVDDFVEVTSHAIAIAEAMAWRRLRAELANIQGMNRRLQWRLEQAQPLFEEAARLWSEEDVPAEVGRSLVNLAQVHYERGVTASAKEALRTAETLARARMLKGLEAQVLGFLGSVLVEHEARYDEASKTFARSLSLYRDSHDQAGVHKIEGRLERLRLESLLVRHAWGGVASESASPLYRGEGRLHVDGAWRCASHEALADHLSKAGFATRDPASVFAGTLADQILQQGYVNRNTVSLTESFDVARAYALAGGRNPRGVVFTVDRIRLSRAGPVYDSFASMKQSLGWFFQSEFAFLGELVQTLGVRDAGVFLDRIAWETRRKVETGRDLATPQADWASMLPADIRDRVRGMKIRTEALDSLYHAFRGFWLLLVRDAGPVGYYGAFRSVQERLCDVQASATDESRRNPGWQTTPFGYVAKTCRDREFFSTGRVPGDCIVGAVLVS